MASKKGDDEEDKSVESESGWEFHSSDTDQTERSTSVVSSNTTYDANQAETVGGETETDLPQNNQFDSFSWTSAEYVGHEKGPGWFIGLALGAALLAIIVFFVTKHDFISTVMVVVLASAFGVFAARKPQTLEYLADTQGIQIGNKNYGYDHFKSFAIMRDELAHSILLLPLKRFMPSISLYYPEASENDIVGVISNHLPLEERSHDFTEQLMRRIHF